MVYVKDDVLISTDKSKVIYLHVDLLLVSSRFSSTVHSKNH